MIILILLCFNTSAVGAKPNPKVILIIADYLALPDVLDSSLPAMQKMVGEGGVGLICPVGLGAGSTGAGYASISAGKYCWAGSSVDGGFNLQEQMEDEPNPASEVFTRRTGRSDLPAVVHVEIGAIIRENQQRMMRAEPGLLADILYNAGKRTAVFGNADLTDKKRRRASIIASDTSGAVQIGDVSARLMRLDPISPTGFVADSKLLAQTVTNALESADFIVVDFGDVTRVELNKNYFSTQAYESHRRDALRNLDDLLVALLNGPAGRSTIILASMEPKLPDKGQSRRFSPIVIHTPSSRYEHGCLVSTTTRTPGLVSGFDIAPTVLEELGLPRPKNIVGSPMTLSMVDDDSVGFLDDLIVLNRELMFIVLGILAAVGIASTTMAAVMLHSGKDGPRWFGTILRTLLLMSFASPLAMLLAAIGQPIAVNYLARLIFQLIALSVGALVVSALLKKALSQRLHHLPGALPIVAIAIITTVVIFIDACRGGQLARFALPSTTGFKGYRFYGIGNEYMGIWLVAALIVIVWLRECFPGWWNSAGARFGMLLCSAGIVLALGMPQCGANAGGTLCAVIAFGLVYLSGTMGRFNVGHIIILFIGGTGLIAGLGLLDIAMSKGMPSHIGLAASMGVDGGYGPLAATAARKLMMNFRMLGLPQVQIPFIGALPFAALWLLSINRKYEELIEGRPAFRSGITAILVSACAVFMFNDSGVVAASIMLSFLIVAVLYSLLDKQRASERSSCHE